MASGYAPIFIVSVGAEQDVAQLDDDERALWEQAKEGLRLAPAPHLMLDDPEINDGLPVLLHRRVSPTCGVVVLYKYLRDHKAVYILAVESGR